MNRALLTAQLTLAVASLGLGIGCSDDAATSPDGGGGPSAGGGSVTAGGGDVGGGEPAGGGGGGPATPRSCRVAAPEPSVYPLELVSPRAVGSLPSTDAGTPPMLAGHRAFKAYPGVEYNVRAVVIGGSFPYVFSLSGAPQGMTIDECTGEIRWPLPSGTTAEPTLTVTDAEGNTASSPWTIDVGEAGFRFVDAENGSDQNDGTLGSPWQTVAAVLGSTAGEVVYFREGTYATAGLPVDGDDTWARVEVNAQETSVQWIAYPGESPTIDNGYQSAAVTGQFFRFSGDDVQPVYVDGFEVINGYDKGFQLGSWTDYTTFRRLDIHGIAQVIDGSNSAGIMTLSSYEDAGLYGAYQDNDFHDNAPGGIKQYSQEKLLWEDNLFRDSGGGPDLKADVRRFEVRNCTFQNEITATCGLFGNMNYGIEDTENGSDASGEIRYNLMLCSGGTAQEVNQDSMAERIDLYRNTFIGDVFVRAADDEDGPFNFSRNVIVNEATGTDHISFYESTSEDVVTYFENLSGSAAEGLVDESGLLTGASSVYRGSRGHEIP